MKNREQDRGPRLLAEESVQSHGVAFAVNGATLAAEKTAAAIPPGVPRRAPVEAIACARALPVGPRESTYE